MKRELEEKTISSRRVVERGYEIERGKKRLHRTIDEKLGKYEVRTEGYEFIPAMMHLFKRYCADLPENKRNELDVNMAKALDAIPEARKILEKAVVRHDAIPREQKERMFSTKYLDLKIEQAIEIAQMTDIIKASGPTVLTPALQIPTYKYEIDFAYLYCVDESDPEWLGEDEPYVVFGVMTEKMAEMGSAWAFDTPVYEDVNDGDRRPKSGYENLRLYGDTGPMAIDSPVLITATCFEHDVDDVKETVNNIRSMLIAVAAAGASSKSKYGILVAVVAGFGYLSTYLFKDHMRDDRIGDPIALTLTEAEADTLTCSSNPVFLNPLYFNGGDDYGRYKVYLRLTNTTTMTPVSDEGSKPGGGGRPASANKPPIKINRY